MNSFHQIMSEFKNSSENNNLKIRQKKHCAAVSAWMRFNIPIGKAFWKIQFDSLLLTNKIRPLPNWKSTHYLSQVLCHAVLYNPLHLNSSSVHPGKTSDGACYVPVQPTEEVRGVRTWRLLLRQVLGNVFNERMKSALLQIKHEAPKKIFQKFITKNVRFNIRKRIPGVLLFLLLLSSYFEGSGFFFFPLVLVLFLN